MNRPQENAELEVQIIDDILARLIILAPELGVVCKRFNKMFYEKFKEILDYYTEMISHVPNQTLATLKSGQRLYGCFDINIMSSIFSYSLFKIDYENDMVQIMKNDPLHNVRIDLCTHPGIYLTDYKLLMASSEYETKYLCNIAVGNTLLDTMYSNDKTNLISDIRVRKYKVREEDVSYEFSYNHTDNCLIMTSPSLIISALGSGTDLYSTKLHELLFKYIFDIFNYMQDWNNYLMSDVLPKELVSHLYADTTDLFYSTQAKTRFIDE